VFVVGSRSAGIISYFTVEIAVLLGCHMELYSFRSWLKNASASKGSDRTFEQPWRGSSKRSKIFGSKSGFSSHW
jgi:hypothetical protein